MTCLPRSTRRATLLGLVVALLLGTPVPAPAQQVDGDVGGLMLVMDASGSMAADTGDGQTRMAAARQALTSLVDELPDRAQVGLTVYGHRVGNDESLQAEGCQDVEVIRPVGPLDRAQLEQDIGSFEPSGWTPIGTSMRTAADALSAVQGRRTLVLVSDGEDTCAPPDPCEVAGELAAEGVDVTVETIGFQVDDAARDQLQCIAEATGGSYRDAPDATSLADSLEALSLRAYRDYEPVGDPITGGASREEAEPMEVGDHLDELQVPATTERWYRFEVPDGQQFGVSATLVGNREVDTDIATFALEVFPADATSRCDQNQLIGRLGGFGDSAAVRGGPDTDCDEGAEFVARVALSEFDGPVTFPLELNLQTFPPHGSLHPRPGTEPVSGDAVIGGASFTTAPLVEPGTYRDNIRMGESHYWAVEVARGQTLTVDYRALPTTAEERAFAKTLTRSGIRQPGPDGHDAYAAEADFRLDDGFERSTTTEVVGGPRVEEVALHPGVFYVSVNMQSDLETALVDYEVTFTVEGEPLPDPTPSPTATETPTTPDGGRTTPGDAGTTPAAGAPEDDAGTPVWPWVLLALLLVGAGAVALWVRRPAAPEGRGPGGAGS